MLVLKRCVVNTNFVAVWQGKINPKAILKSADWRLLDTREKNRSKLFSRHDLQQKYIQTRVALKTILALYLNSEAQNIKINLGKYGKPTLSTTNLHFSLAHTKNMFVVAISNINQIGIDLEQKQPRANLSALVDKCFASSESKYWHGLTEAEKITTFYKFWVSKEAFVKAVGHGIVLGLNKCVVDSQRQNLFLSIPPDFGLPSNWQIKAIKLTDEVVCAVVIKAIDFKYTQSEFKP